MTDLLDRLKAALADRYTIERALGSGELVEPRATSKEMASCSTEQVCPTLIRRLRNAALVAGLVCVQLSPSEGQEVALGVMVAVNNASQDDRDSRLGFAGGIGVSLAFSHLISVRLEGLATEKGWDESSDMHMHMTYAELPLLLAVGQHGGGLQPFVSIGIAPAFELSCRYVYPAPPLPPDTGIQNVPLGCSSRRDEKVDFGGVFSAGVEVDIGSFRSALEGRYTHGLVDLDSGSEWSKVRNRVASVVLRVMLPLAH
jgi:hypothetical protein